MSGAGRRSGYRKTVTDDVLHGLPEPSPTESVSLIARGTGSNLFDVLLESGEHAIAMLPSKFRKLVWLKRGDYVIVSAASGSTQTSRGTSGAVTHAIEHVLYAPAIKHLRDIGRWPEALEAARAAVCAAAQEGAGAELGAGASSEVAGSDCAVDPEGGIEEEAFERIPVRRMQGLRGMPPPTENDEEEAPEEKP